MSQNSRQSEVPTQAGSLGIGGSAGLLSVLVGTPDIRQKFEPSEVPTHVRSPDTCCGLAGCLTALVGSPNVRRKFRLSEVPMIAGSSDTDLHARTSGPM